MLQDMNIFKYYQTGYCKKKNNCEKIHNIKECIEKCCRNHNCTYRHRKLCSYFENVGKCKFGSYCEFKHRKPELFGRIEKLESTRKCYKI